MTEEGWLQGTNPVAMLRWLGEQGTVSARKVVLYRVGYLRSLWPRLNVFERSEVDDEDRRAERRTRPPITEEVVDAWCLLRHQSDGLAEYLLSPVARAAQAALLPDLFGNPFRRVHPAPSLLKWNDGAIVKLAQAIYEDRDLPSGRLDRARLSVLADALEEAGCIEAEILGHLRVPGPHTRGCWALDVVRSVD